MRQVAVVLALFALSGCGGAKMVITGTPVKPASPLRLLVTVSDHASFGDALSKELSQRGYGILSPTRTASVLKLLGLDPEDLEDNQVLADLRTRRVDAVMKLVVGMIGRNSQLLKTVQVSVFGTVAGELLASMNWTNSWSGAVGSPADSIIRLSPSAAAKAVAEALVAQLGPPGAKTRIYMDDLLAEKRSRVRVGGPKHRAPVPAARARSSDIDFPKRQGPTRPNDFALVIGIEDYQSLPSADYGVHDARTVRKHLEALGIPSRNIISLEGSAATGNKIKSYIIDWLPRNVKSDSTLFIYYSGHGAPDPSSGDAYIVPWDGDPKFLKITAYPLKKFYADISKIKARRIVVVLDACFSGAGGRSVLAKGARPLVVKVNEAVPKANNLVVLAAASGDEITSTLEEQGHGLFTYFFLKGLSGEARKNGSVTPRSLYDYIKPHVQDEARRQNREQTPVLVGVGVDEPLFD